MRVLTLFPMILLFVVTSSISANAMSGGETQQVCLKYCADQYSKYPGCTAKRFQSACPVGAGSRRRQTNADTARIERRETAASRLGRRLGWPRSFPRRSQTSHRFLGNLDLLSDG